jgi:acetyl esterase/lipase
MPSEEAEKLWAAFRAGPKQVDLALPARREAGEHAEHPTAEPRGVTYVEAVDVDGLWAIPAQRRDGTAVLYLFGGGYVLGSPASRRKTAGHVATATGSRVLVPNYRLAPAYRFPATVEDATRAYRWLLDHDTRPDRTVVMGDSAGGGLAVAMLVALRGDGDHLPAGCVVLSPWADLACTGASMEGRREVDIMCTRDSLLEMAGWYLAGHDPQDPLASPVHGDLTGLPPLLALVGGDEILLDDALRLVSHIAAGGSDAALFIGGGMQHVWPIWVGALPEADAAVAMIGSWVQARTT